MFVYCGLYIANDVSACNQATGSVNHSFWTSSQRLRVVRTWPYKVIAHHSQSCCPCHFFISGTFRQVTLNYLWCEMMSWQALSYVWVNSNTSFLCFFEFLKMWETTKVWGTEVPQWGLSVELECQVEGVQTEEMAGASIRVQVMGAVTAFPRLHALLIDNDEPLKNWGWGTQIKTQPQLGFKFVGGSMAVFVKHTIQKYSSLMFAYSCSYFLYRGIANSSLGQELHRTLACVLTAHPLVLPGESSEIFIALSANKIP